MATVIHDATTIAHHETKLVGGVQWAPLDPAVSQDVPVGRPGRQQIIATLERWLENLRGGIGA